MILLNDYANKSDYRNNARQDYHIYLFDVVICHFKEQSKDQVVVFFKENQPYAIL